MRLVISASVACPNRLKDAAVGKVESFLSSKGEESYCVDVGRRRTCYKLLINNKLIDTFFHAFI